MTHLIRRRILLGATAMGLVLGVSSETLAQTAPSTSSGNPEEVVVTATRVARSGYTAPTPTIVVGADQIEKQGATNIAQVLDLLPSVKADQGPQTNGVRSINPGANYVDLHGLSAIRTLVLIDGARVVPQVVSGLDSYQVDLNMVPTMMVDHVDVVTGGASAQWGSDAIGGVVNVVLKKDFEGLDADFQGGQSIYGDNRDGRVGAVGGTSFAGGRGHIEAAIDYENNGGVGDEFTRPWGKQGYQLVTATSGPYTDLIAPNVQFSTIAPGGLITGNSGTNPTLLKGITFGPGGAPYNFVYGTQVGSSNMIGGGQPGYNIDTGVSIEPTLQRVDLYGRASYDVSDSLNIHFETSYAASRAVNTTLPARDTTPVTIHSGNPFIPASIQAVMTTDNIATLSLGRADYDFGTVHGDVRDYTFRTVLGADGSFGDGWTWNAHYTYGQNHYSGLLFNDRIKPNYTAAANVVVSGGVDVCANLAANPGCVPLDLFGYGSPSKAAIAYVTGTNWTVTDYQQNALAVNINGEPISTWAGPVSVAAGLEYRFELMRTQVNATSAAAEYETGNGAPLSGHFSVSEGYFETVIPLLKDVTLGDTTVVKSFDLNGAVRVSDYSGPGVEPTWKLGLTYVPIEGLLLRGTRSQDIRAPNLYELNSAPSTTNQTVALPAIGNYNATQVNAIVITSGNAALMPETALTSTGGFAYEPPSIPGLSTSLDYYTIDLLKAISSTTAAQTANLCGAGSTFYCSFITETGSGSGTPTGATIHAVYQNLASVDMDGFDVSASYRQPLHDLDIDLPGKVEFIFAANYTLHSYVNLGTPAAENAALSTPGHIVYFPTVIDRAGEVGPSNNYSLPHLQMTPSVGYSVDRASITVQVHYIGGGHYDNTFNNSALSTTTINNNNIGAVAYVNLLASYQIADNYEIFGTIYNLLNKAPPPDPASIGYSTNPTYYDMIGTTWTVGARIKF